MAISGADGSIVLTTKVDQSGLNRGMTSMQKGVKSLSSSFKALGSTIAAVFSITAILNFSKQAGEFATQTEASVQRLVDIYGEAAQSVGDFIDANARAIGLSKSAGASIAATYGNLLSVWADQETNARLTNNLLNQTAVVASKTGRTTTDVAERIRSGLLGNTEAIEDLGINVNIKTIEITDAFKRIADGRSWEQLDAYEQAQVRTLAILEQSTKKYGTTVAQTSATVRNQYQAAYEDFKNTWGQVVNTVLIPVLKVLTKVFTIATKGLQIIAGLTGKTIDTSTAFSSQEKAIGGAVDNQNDLTDAVKGTNKELKKSLAGFDEINTLSNDTADSGGYGSAGVSVSGIGDVVGIGDVFGDYDNSFVEKIDADLAAIMGIVGGALVAIGLLLIFFGHIGWGIGFIIAGASIFAVSMATVSSNDQVTPISEKLMTIMAIAGIALTAIGLILLFNGSWKWGIGFIIAGASALAVSIVAVESGNATEQAEQMLLDIMVIAGSAMLALGVILMCCGVISPLSIGLVVAGAGSLAGAIAINPQAVGEILKAFFVENAGLITGISLALLVLGIVLCVCGIVTPLSIGMIVAGAAGLVAEIALNWNYIVEKVTSFFQDNAGLIVGVSIALIVLGIILLFTGVGIPLAIGLIVAGGGALAATVALNWNFIVDKVKEVWGKIKDFWNTHIAPIFTAKWWKDLGKACLNGLIIGFEAGINGIIKAFESMINWIVGGLNKIAFDIPDWLGGGSFGINLPRASFGKVKIPRLAQGAVIPPNREFLAVLGDQKHGKNIEAPLDTIVEAFNIALSRNASNSSQDNRPIILQIDGREIARATREGNAKLGSQTVFGGFANAY